MKSWGKGQRRRLARLGLAALLCSGLLLGAGCKVLAAPWLLWGPEPTRLVRAEYPYLKGKKVCLLVWAEMDTLFVYPHVRYEVAEQVAQALTGKVEGISFVPNRQVERLQRREPDWDRSDPALLGRRFGAERVLMVELTQYTTREPDSPHLYRGHISANLKVYDTARRHAEPSYRTVVETAYPAEAVAPWGTSESAIRLAMMQAFAEQVAGKFYDRRIKVR